MLPRGQESGALAVIILSSSIEGLKISLDQGVDFLQVLS